MTVSVEVTKLPRFETGTFRLLADHHHLTHYIEDSLHQPHFAAFYIINSC